MAIFRCFGQAADCGTGVQRATKRRNGRVVVFLHNVLITPITNYRAESLGRHNFTPRARPPNQGPPSLNITTRS
jgi:hypothetical protein